MQFYPIHMGCLAVRMFVEKNINEKNDFCNPYYKEMRYERTCVLQTQVLRSHLECRQINNYLQINFTSSRDEVQHNI